MPVASFIKKSYNLGIENVCMNLHNTCNWLTKIKITNFWHSCHLRNSFLMLLIFNVPKPPNIKKTWLIIMAYIITFFFLNHAAEPYFNSQYHNNRICRKGNHGNQLNVLQQLSAQKNMQYHHTSTPTTSTLSTHFLFSLILIIKQALHTEGYIAIVTGICYRSSH